ncbi:MAG: ABC-type transport auxiliary lipoprotein family protein [Gammaproteobacteria bacterium]
MNKNFFFSLLLLMLGLTSCSMFSPVKLDTQHKYVLDSLPNPEIKKSGRHSTLLVAQPETNSIYRTTQMAYTVARYQVGYFAENSWAERPGDMLQPLITETLQNTRHYHAVLMPSTLGKYDYILNTQIQTLLQDYTHMPATLEMTLRAEIVRAATNRVIATKQFTVIEIIPQRTPYSGVAAANRATASILRQLAQFCLRST